MSDRVVVLLQFFNSIYGIASANEIMTFLCWQFRLQQWIKGSIVFVVVIVFVYNC